MGRERKQDVHPSATLTALDHFLVGEQAVKLWRRGGAGQPNELELIKSEVAFSESVRSRDDFQELVGEGP